MRGFDVLRTFYKEEVHTTKSIHNLDVLKHLYSNYIRASNPFWNLRLYIMWILLLVYNFHTLFEYRVFTLNINILQES